jgi:hypothetical protein
MRSTVANATSSNNNMAKQISQSASTGSPVLLLDCLLMNNLLSQGRDTCPTLIGGRLINWLKMLK